MVDVGWPKRPAGHKWLVYGYGNSAFAIGAFLMKAVPNPAASEREFVDVPLDIPPLIMSSEIEPLQLESSIGQLLESSVMSALAHIANELG